MSRAGNALSFLQHRRTAAAVAGISIGSQATIGGLDDNQARSRAARFGPTVADVSDQPPRPPFGNMWPWVEYIDRRESAAIDRMQRAIDTTVDQYYRMVALIAGVIAFVPSLLAQSRIPVNGWYVHRGLVSLFVSFAWGVIILCLIRYATLPLMLQVQRSFHRLGVLTGEVFGGAAPGEDIDVALGAAFSKYEEEQKPIRRGIWIRIASGFIGEVLFYGSFLYGARCLFRAVY
jgi:hypothetical protein